MSKKLLLIEPPFYRLFKASYTLDRVPLGPAYLAAAVRKNTSWQVLLYNSDFQGLSEQVKLEYLADQGYRNYVKQLADQDQPIWLEIQKTIETYKPDVVGISSKSHNFSSALRVAAATKAVNPEITVIAGGAHPTAQPAAVMAHPDIDVVVRGEGEETLIELLKALESGKDFSMISGINYREKDNIIKNPTHNPIKDLDQLPFPHELTHETLMNFKDYPVSAFKYIFATRGCPYRCMFCGSRYIWGNQVRYRSPENVVKEIQNLQEKGLRLVHFSDDTFGVNTVYLKEICNAIASNCPGLIWSCETHVNLINDETVSLMKKSGCHSIEIGIESGNNTILKTIRKNITIEQALAACETISRHGLEVVGLFMAGFLDETEATLNDTFTAMKKAKCDRIHFGLFTPYPGTEAFKRCEEAGMINNDYDPVKIGHQSLNNYFCRNISPERFKESVTVMKKMADRKNAASRAKHLFSRVGIARMQEMGLGQSFTKVRKYFFGR